MHLVWNVESPRQSTGGLLMYRVLQVFQQFLLFIMQQLISKVRDESSQEATTIGL